MNGDAFANAVTIADFHAGRFASIFQILVNFADGSELIDLIVTADFGVTINDNVRLQYGAFADFDVGATIQNGPMWTLAPITAPSSTMAVG